MKCDDPLNELYRLVEADDPDLQDALLEALRHPWQHVRIFAAIKLAELFQDMQAVPILAEALEEGNTRQRRAASNALWEIGDADAQGLLEMLYYANTALHDTIARALDLSGWLPDDVEIETAYYITTGQWQACIALGKVAVPVLMGALHSWDGNVRRAAAWVLGEIGDPRAVGGLIGRLCDTEGGLFGVGDRVCDVAAEALAKIGTPEALAAIGMVPDMRRGE